MYKYASEDEVKAIMAKTQASKREQETKEFLAA